MVISKSEFMMFLKHPAWLWLKKFDKDKLPLPDDALQALFDEGTLFEGYAEKLFPDAVKLGYKNGNDFSGTKYYALPEATLSEIKKGTKVILQGRLEVNGLTSVFDVLERVGSSPAGEEFNLYEIKSSTQVKTEHIPDLAFQTIVLEDSGFKVRQMYVLHVNNEYHRQGEIMPEDITKRSDVTDKVRDAVAETREEIAKAKKILESKTMPDMSPRHVRGGADVMDEWFAIMQMVRGDFPQYSIYRLCSPKPETFAWLEDNGVETLDQIPPECPLTDKQLRQVEAMKSGLQKVDQGEIKDFLNSLKYPLYFLDYETFAGVIPAFDGYRPYQQVPFQYSLHILPAPGAEVVHKEYLHTENSDPVPALVEHLYNDFGQEGSVISWYMTFEKSRNAEMAALMPKYESFLTGVNDRMVDLMTPFAKGWFVDKEFFGRASIKWVLPALLPNFSYKELNITNGADAQRIWMETVMGDKNQEKKDEIMADLIKYCTLDTYAMYAIYKYLLERIT